MSKNKKKINFKAWMLKWIENQKRLGKIKKSTLAIYEGYINNHILPYLGKYYLNKITPKVINNFCDYEIKVKKVNLNTLKNIKSVVHKALNEAVLLEIIKNNPTDYVTLPKYETPKVQVLSINEEEKLCSMLNEENMNIGIGILIALNTGLRLGEILALRWQNIDFKKCTMEVEYSLSRQKSYDEKSKKKTKLVLDKPKTKSSQRIVPLNNTILNILKNHKERKKVISNGKDINDDFVVSKIFGKATEPKTFYLFFKRILKEAEIRNIKFHCLRHTFTAKALKTKTSDKVISEILGHSNIVTTLNVYGHISNEMKEELIKDI